MANQGEDLKYLTPDYWSGLWNDGTAMTWCTKDVNMYVYLANGFPCPQSTVYTSG